MKKGVWGVFLIMTLFFCLSCEKKKETVVSKKSVPKVASSQKVSKSSQAETENASFKETPNQPPQITEITFVPSQPVTGDTLKVEVKAHDPEGDHINYFFIWQVNGETVQQSDENVLHYALKAGDEVVVTAIASDGRQKGNPVSNMVVVGNAPPNVCLLSQQLKGDVYQAQLKVDDPEGDQISFSLKEAPQGMQINEQGLISWRIEKGLSGEFPVVVEVQDGYGGKAILSFKVKIKRVTK